ncbi:unnamed protein product [Paramecium sonneborni]|uniref:RING-type domain-containing protein n=1 Tax=Paramecium sonneborni TaxID=65129 RepID=A0A8S1Q2W0_9CILI|nr:unnamed protein product [Paramecium sonneborni]
MQKIQTDIKQGKQEDQTLNEQCEICYTEIKIKGLLAKCKHYFCFNCVLKWTKKQKSCPKCRSQVTKICKSWKRKTNRPLIIYLSNSESDNSDSDQDYIPIDTLVGKYGPEDFI